MARVVVRYEELIVLVLMAFLMVVVGISTLELGWLLLKDLLNPGPRLLVDAEEVLELVAFFMIVLVGVELLATLKSYLYDRVIHGEVVLEVSLIAMAQKIIIIDTRGTGAPTLFGLAGLVVALALAFWIVRIARRPRPPANPG